MAFAYATSPSHEPHRGPIQQTKQESVYNQSSFQSVERWQSIRLPSSMTGANNDICLSITINKPAIILIPNIINWRVLINSLIVPIIT